MVGLPRLTVMFTRSAPAVPRGVPSHRSWGAAVLLVLGGLLGMHGLASHCTSNPAPVPHLVSVTPQHSTAADPIMDSSAAHSADASLTGVVSLSLNGTYNIAPNHTGGTHGIGALCAAVLGAGLLVRIRRYEARRRARALSMDRLAPPLGPVRSRDPDPPSLIWLSIRRC